MKDIICHKCGKPGHYANKCLTKKKIESLEIDEDIKQKNYNILLNSDDESNTPSDSEESENNIFEIVSTSSEEKCSSEEDKCASHCQMEKDYYKSILQMNELNVLNKNETLTLDLIDQIQDPIEKRRILIEKYIDQSKELKITKTYSLQEVINKLVVQPEKEITLQDLKQEVNEQKERN